jgi:hypothetical protein
MDIRSSAKKPHLGSALSIIVGITMAVLGAASATASVIYDYTGPNFATAFSPYTTSDNVTASITLNAALGPNLPFSPITPTAFVFKDGVQTISDTTPNVTLVSLFFSTDSTGGIFDWNAVVDVQVGIGITDQIQTIGVHGASPFFQDEGQFPAGTSAFALTNSNTGQWTIQSQSAVPEPSTWAMMILGFCGLGFMAYRRKSKLTSSAA